MLKHAHAPLVVFPSVRALLYTGKQSSAFGLSISGLLRRFAKRLPQEPF